MGQALSWLLENLREDSTDNVVAFKSPNMGRTGTGTDLIHQAGSLIAAVEEIAHGVEIRAQLLWERELQMTQQFNDWVAEANEALKGARSHLATVDSQLDAAERRAETAEQRAVELERGLSRIEKALQKKFFDVETPTRHFA